MSWQSDIYKILLDGQLHQLSDLFSVVEPQIKMHHAYRRVAAARLTERPEEKMGTVEAKWNLFAVTLSQMQIECNSSNKNYFLRDPKNSVKLKSPGSCPKCGTPAYRIGWYGSNKTSALHCKNCQIKFAATLSPRPYKRTKPKVEPKPEPRAEVINYVDHGFHENLFMTIMEAAKLGEDLHLSPTDVAVLSCVGDIRARALKEGHRITETDFHRPPALGNSNIVLLKRKKELR
jgi:hypothetical protein